MPQDQAIQLLSLLNSFIQSFKEHNLSAMASPEEYQQVIAALRQSHPIFHNESDFFSKRITSYIEEQSEGFGKELSKSKLDINKLAEDIRTSSKLDASLEKKRLDEVQSSLVQKRKEVEEASKRQVEFMEKLPKKLERDNSKVLMGKKCKI